MNTYGRNPCWLCGQIVSSNGLATASHLKVHIREGYLELIEWNPNVYARTDKRIDKAQYQVDHPDKAYTQDDYWPSDIKRP